MNLNKERAALHVAYAIATATLGATSSEALAADQGPVLEEMLVTASKRTQTLLELPQSIAALDERVMSALSVNDVQDYANFVPGLDITAPAPGMGIVSLILPTLFNVAAALCIWKFPLDRRRAGIIRRCIELRAARHGAANLQSAPPMKV